MFRNNKEVLRFTTLLMAIVMIAMVILPAVPASAQKYVDPLYSEKATSNINYIFTDFIESEGLVVNSGQSDMDGFHISILKDTMVDVESWNFEDQIVLNSFESLIADAKILETTEEPLDPKHLANLYIGAETLGKTTDSAILLDYLIERQKNATNGAFVVKEWHQWSNLPAFNILSIKGKLGELVEIEAAVDYILGLQLEDNSFGDFQSTAQATRVLIDLKDLSTQDDAIAVAINKAKIWLKEQQQADGSFGSGQYNDPIVNSAEVVFTMFKLGEENSTYWNHADSSRTAIDYLSETAKFSSANITANAWALKAFMLYDADPDRNPILIGENLEGKVKIRIEGPDYTILPETSVEIEGQKSYPDILLENAEKFDYTVQVNSYGFVDSINGITKGGYWMVTPYQATYGETDSFVLYGAGSTNLGEVTLSKTKAEPKDIFTATVKYKNGTPVEGATVIYYAENKMTSPTAIETLTNVQGKVNVSIDTEGTYYIAAHKKATEFPEDNPDNGLIRTLPKTITIQKYVTPTTEKIKVDVAVIDDDGEVIYGPKSVRLYSDDKFELTALGALEETGLDYEVESNNSFVTEIEGIKNKGLSGWMFAVNGKAPGDPAIDTTIDDGDEILWYYSNSASSKVPDFPDEEDLEEDEDEEDEEDNPVYVIPPRRTFSDVGANILWAKDAIELLAGRGIISGTETGAFEPNRLINRAEFAKLVIETLGDKSLSQGTAMFSDIDSTKWYADYVGKAFTKGLIEGNNGKFRPMESITRNEVALILHRMQNSVLPNNGAISFTDGMNIPEWARNAVAFSVERGLIKGYDDNTFRGEQLMTRAEVAVVLYRYIQMMNL
ncbi:MAG: S-layer homology domain-containing protein [Gudongella sp.]|nr:S-layer homology domain-containing protein [Gudongella sp.]